MSDPVARLNAALEGRYRIERELGEGGMATVYLADDLRHERKVALKVLKPDLTAAVGAGRFLAEIKTTANLQHPHILPLFDSGEADGFLFYVMPYVDGESLRERLDREHQLPVGEAVQIATNVAEALDYAHSHGVIHRDIKPANILLQAGKPVVADFGIALAVSGAGGQRLTETGMALGTMQYMSPEQATGSRTVGAATDIWALGCVLFEMLAGEPPFTGSTPQAVLGRIIASEPVAPSTARGTVPIHVDAAIRCATERVPADRFGRAADFARALADPGFRHGQPVGVPATAARPGRSLAIAGGLLAAFAVGVLVPMALRPDRAAPVIRYELTFPVSEAPPMPGSGGAQFALSEDGSRMAYVGPSVEGGSQIWIRDRDQEAGRPIAGTRGGIHPFFAPDGRRVGFIDQGAFDLRIVSLDGGPPSTLVGGGVQRSGASWGRDGYVYYIGETFGLYRVAATGGEGQEVAPARPEEGITAYSWPDALPGNKGVLVTLAHGPGVDSDYDVGVIDLESGRPHALVGGTHGRYLSTGHLVFVTHEGDLVAAPFDENELRITGPAVPLESGLPRLSNWPDMALSRSGRLVYQSMPEPTRYELVWADRSGSIVPVEPGWTFLPHPTGQQPALSPGDRQIALGAMPDQGLQEIWVKEIDGPRFRLPFDGAAYRPTWSPDGESVVFLSDVRNAGDVWTRRADGAGEPEVLVEMEGNAAQASWAPDGTWLLLRTASPSRGDIFGFSPAHDTIPRRLIATEFFEAEPALSPDGRFLAYVTDAAGGVEVLVRPYPDLDAITKVTFDGGFAPLWSHSGQELFYVSWNRGGGNALVAARVDTRDEFRILGRDTLFTMPPGLVVPGPYISSYDVTEDGQRFLMFRCVDDDCEPREGRYHVVENFDQEILRRMRN